jgi:hypothetical protein
MKNFHYVALASLLAFTLACGGGSTSSPSTTAPDQTSPGQDEAAGGASEKADDPGMGDEDRIPPKPKPFISVGSLVSSNQASAGAPVKSVPAVEAEKAIKRVIEMFVALSEGMTKAGDDCDAVAASIRTWTATYAAELRQMMPTLLALDQHMTAEREQEIEKELAPVGKSIEATMKKCAENQAVMNAFMEMATAVQEEKQAEPLDEKKASE